MLTLRFIPRTEIEGLSTNEKIKLLVDIVKEDKIILLEGKLKKTEEADLIKKVMEEISTRFRGIEIAELTPGPKKEIAFFAKLKEELINLLLRDRQGLTIIGPATVIKEIKKDPNKIELLTKEPKKKK